MASEDEEKGYVVFKQHPLMLHIGVGKCETPSGEVLELKVSASDYSPFVVLADGRVVKFNWEGLVKQAISIAEKERGNEI